MKEERPRTVLAVGDAALTAARKVRGIPVETILSLAFNLQKQPPEHIGGVTMAVSPVEYLKIFSGYSGDIIPIIVTSPDRLLYFYSNWYCVPRISNWYCVPRIYTVGLLLCDFQMA